MYHIAICDDEKEFIREITNLLRRYEKRAEKSFESRSFVTEVTCSKATSRILI